MARNAPEDQYVKNDYEAMQQRYQGSYNTFTGPTGILISADILQAKDFSD